MRWRKKTRKGRLERRRLIDAYFGAVAFDVVRQRHPRRKEVGNDDILDAFAALWTAERIFHHQARAVPEEESRDSQGLRMEIVH